jgi:hypothetical protein
MKRIFSGYSLGLRKPVTMRSKIRFRNGTDGMTPEVEFPNAFACLDSNFEQVDGFACCAFMADDHVVIFHRKLSLQIFRECDPVEDSRFRKKKASIDSTVTL